MSSTIAKKLEDKFNLRPNHAEEVVQFAKGIGFVAGVIVCANIAMKVADLIIPD